MSAVYCQPAFLAYAHTTKEAAHIAVTSIPEIQFMGISQCGGQRYSRPTTYLVAFEVDANFVCDYLSVHAFVCC